ncbi:MAG: hypothetical protein NTW19_04560 [Planctomycetota bacterium]|nr:hypothetical protein [Planctomycetota bacterium]
MTPIAGHGFLRRSTTRQRLAAFLLGALGVTSSAAFAEAPPLREAGRPPAAAPRIISASAAVPTQSGAPLWLRDKLTAAVDDAFSGVFTCQTMRFDPPRTIVLEGVLLEPKRPFGWAELAAVPAGGPPRRFDGRLTIERATLELASAPSEGSPLAVSRLTLDKPTLLGADNAVVDSAGGDGPRVEAGVDRNRSTANTRTRLSPDPLRSSFEHLNVAIHTLPPTVSTIRLRKFMPLDALTIRGGQIVTPAGGGSPESSCGIDLNAEGEANGQWRFGLALTAPTAKGWTQVRTQGTGNPDMGAINMTNLKFLSVSPEGQTTELDVGQIRLRLSVERGPANGDRPLPSVDTSAIDSLPPAYGTGK